MSFSGDLQVQIKVCGIFSALMGLIMPFSFCCEEIFGHICALDAKIKKAINRFDRFALAPVCVVS